ncbi:MAG: alanine--tRNA ligase [Deltaproteobacteria bacterium]|nr:alanine--tRNA ligase [Deltaproteobacteria bacterium]
MAKKLSGAQVRQSFIDYFKSKGHTAVTSSSLVPENDPTLLFSNAGMNQFKDLFLGTQRREYVRAVTSQKCLRISGKHNDLENVGVTARHHTFFEMLGNFSFGDYFKADAIKFAWEYVTEVLGVEKGRLWVTVFEKDDEAEQLWRDLTDVAPDKILRMGEKDNFWAMGETGPCGPCSEIHYYLGDDASKQSKEGFLADDGSYLEIWNLVFMQFDRSADGTMKPLPKPSVDTGMGLERITAVLQGVKSNYDCDLLRPVISKCEQLSGFKYDGSSYKQRDLKSDPDYARDVAMRVIADHSRSIAFLIADGVMPGSDGRGYVLRRLIRRAVRHARILQFKEPFLPRTTEVVIKMFGSHYPELNERREVISRVAEAEEVKFYETLDAGITILQRECEKLKRGSLFPGELAFQLHDTFGFPLDLTEDALKAYNMKVDTAAFEKAMQQQKSRSREDRKSHAKEFVSIKLDGKKTEFLGYDTLSAESRVVRISDLEGRSDAVIKPGGSAAVFFEATPFYAESGGQVGDTGQIQIGETLLKVLDTQKVQDGFILHNVEVVRGELSPKLLNENAQLAVDAERRLKIRLNHSATHLLHSALRKVLGAHVKQAGSKVDDEALRFDFTHFAPLSESELAEIQEFMNQEARANYAVETRVMGLDEAKKLGAMALFGEKYGDTVRVVEIGPNSLELCGGTHAARSGDIGFVVVQSENGVSAGVRRIECLAGPGAAHALIDERLQVGRLGEILKGDGAQLVEKVEKLIARTRQLEKELEASKSKLASAASGDLMETARVSPRGIKVIAQKVEAADSETLKSMVDKLRVKIGSGVVALGSSQGEGAVIIAGATPDLASTVNVGTIIKQVAQLSGGRGGGRADFAQAGGVDPSRLSIALDKVFELVG